MTIDQKVKAYHYTNMLDYSRIKTGSGYGRTGLLPIKRLVSYGVHGLPEKAHDSYIFCLPEPEPMSWKNNKEFPLMWNRFMNNVCKGSELVLLSFDVLPEDNAYVIDWAHVERMLRKYEEPTKKQRTVAGLKYWNSRVPVSKYDSSYSLPELIVNEPIPLERLNFEWAKERNPRHIFINDNKPWVLENISK